MDDSAKAIAAAAVVIFQSPSRSNGMIGSDGQVRIWAVLSLASGGSGLGIEAFGALVDAPVTRLVAEEIVRQFPQRVDTKVGPTIFTLDEFAEHADTTAIEVLSVLEAVAKSLQDTD